MTRTILVLAALAVGAAAQSAPRKIKPPKLYRVAQAAEITASAWDARETYFGLGHPCWVNGGYPICSSESGEAKWFVDPRSGPKVTGFYLGEDAAVLAAAHWLAGRKRGRWMASALLFAQAARHVSGAVSWTGRER